MEKTVKQLAEEYGLTKQALSYHIKKLPKDCKNYVEKNGSKTLYINEKGQELLQEKVSKKGDKKTDKIDIKENALYDALLKQLEIKDKQIEALQKALDQEQQLHALSKQKILALEKKEEDPQPDPEQLRHWWQWKKKKN